MPITACEELAPQRDCRSMTDCQVEQGDGSATVDLFITIAGVESRMLIASAMRTKFSLARWGQ